MNDVQQLDVSPKIISALKAAKLLDFKTIIISPHAQLSRATKLSYQEVELLIKAVSQKVVRSKLVPAFHMLGDNCLPEYRSHRLSLGCEVLDDLLRGGIRTGGITEICGESASGKTQFCLQLALRAQLPPTEGGLASGVVYICTECTFPIKRLYQLIKELTAVKTISGTTQNALADNVTICQIGDVTELKQCIEKYLPVLIKARNVKVVIIDSVAAVFRAAYEKNETGNRALDLQNLGYSLHCISLTENLVVICVNQVTDVMSDSHFWCGPMENVAPALGLSWANVITTRLMLSRTSKRITTLLENGLKKDLAVPAVICKAKVVFAPDLPDNSVYYIVTDSGLKGIDLQIFNTNEILKDGTVS